MPALLVVKEMINFQFSLRNDFGWIQSSAGADSHSLCTQQRYSRADRLKRGTRSKSIVLKFKKVHACCQAHQRHGQRRTNDWEKKCDWNACEDVVMVKDAIGRTAITKIDLSGRSNLRCARVLKLFNPCQWHKEAATCSLPWSSWCERIGPHKSLPQKAHRTFEISLKAADQDPGDS